MGPKAQPGDPGAVVFPTAIEKTPIMDARVAQSLTPGSRLGRYLLEKLLATGATAAVFLARDTELDTLVALKVLAPVVMSDEEALKRLRRELVLARSVVHPGICRVFELSHEGEVHFISMEYIRGATLAAILKEEGTLEVLRAVRLTRALCRALKAAHRAGIVHRDLKPGNIMVTPANRPVLMDFGFACTKDADLEPITRAGSIVGTLPYLAPEVLLGHAATPASDQYALAVTLYETITGRHPFIADSPPALRLAHEKVRPIHPARFNAQASDELGAVVMKALSVSPEQRFPGIADFERALAELVLDEAIDLSDASISAPWNRNLDAIHDAVTTDEVDSDIIRGNIRPTTVFFSDIVGITAYFDQHGDVTGRKRLQTHHRLLLPLVRDHDGVVIKTIGDAIMAVFPRADDAVAAALAMQGALSEHNLHVPDVEHLHVRIGIHSGDAIVERRDVFGDTVNVTARICSKAKGDQILVSAATQALLLPHSVMTTPVFRTELRGKRGVFELFAVSQLDLRTHDTCIDIPDRLALQRGGGAGDAHTRKTLEDLPVIKPGDIELELTSPARPTLRTGSARPKWSRMLLVAGPAIAIGMVTWVWTGQRADVAPPGNPSPVNEAVPMPEPPSVSQPTNELAPGQVFDQPAPRRAISPANDSETPSRPPSRPGSAGTAAVRRQALAARAALEAGLREKGLIPGDHRELDTARQRLTDLLRREQYSEATRVAEDAQKRVSGVDIDRAFVKAKIARFNVQFDATTDAGTRARVSSLVETILASFARGDFAGANRDLNRGFDMLAGGAR